MADNNKEIVVKEWKTAVADIKPNKVLLRGYPIDKLMGNLSYAQVVYLALKGELPDENVGKIVDTILVSSVDHGVTPPSALAAITAASTGAPINAAIASGILAINRFHGGAIENAMQFFYELKEKVDSSSRGFQTTVSEYMDELRAQKKRVMGFGHRVHSDDPRTKKLFGLATELNIATDYIELAREVENKLFQQLGKRLPINVDGAIAAVLCGLEFNPDIANAFFIMSRIPGLVAHIAEERVRQRPMRRIEPSGWVYDGPEERDI